MTEDIEAKNEGQNTLPVPTGSKQAKPIPDFIRKTLNLQEDTDESLVDLATEERAVLVCAIAPYTSLRVSPVHEVNASIGLQAGPRLNSRPRALARQPTAYTYPLAPSAATGRSAHDGGLPCHLDCSGRLLAAAFKPPDDSSSSAFHPTAGGAGSLQDATGARLFPHDQPIACLSLRVPSRIP